MRQPAVFGRLLRQVDIPGDRLIAQTVEKIVRDTRKQISCLMRQLIQIFRAKTTVLTPIGKYVRGQILGERDARNTGDISLQTGTNGTGGDGESDPRIPSDVDA